MAASMMAGSAKWVDGLTCVESDPLYYEGVVDDVNATLELHRQETVSTVIWL